MARRCPIAYAVTCDGVRPMTMELESPLVMWALPLASTMPASYCWCDAAALSVEMACRRHGASYVVCPVLGYAVANLPHEQLLV